MKKIILSFVFLITACALFAADMSASDAQLYNEVKQTFENGFYPGTVSAADQLQKNYPESTFTHNALAYKGEALINMESYDEAVKTLESAIAYMHSGSAEIIRSTYLLGRAYYQKGDYNSAIDKLYLACKLCLTNDSMEWYAQSVLYSGRVFYKIEQYKDSVPLFEYVVSNGNSYSSNEYTEGLQKLFIAYNKTGNSKKTISLFEKINQSDFENEIYYTLCLYYGDACAEAKQNQKAYDAYCRVLESGVDTLAVSALKKAYVISSENNIADSGEVLATTKENFKDNPELLNEFWLRLAIDEYNSKNYSKSETYLANIDAQENTETWLLQNLYTAKIVLEQNRPVNIAEEKLLSVEAFVKKSTTENVNDSFYSALLQCKVQLEKWDEVPAVYAKIKNPDDNAKYAISSYYYRNGQYEKVDSGCGELFASALCKMGRYEAACSEYARLNSLEFDYAMALFLCGRYEQSYKISASGNSEKKDYLCGLCCVNLRLWKKASEHFASYISKNSSSSDFAILSLYYKGYAEYNSAEFKNAYSSFVRFAMESPVKENSYVLKSYEYAVKAALQSGDFKNASVQAGNLVRYSKDGEPKQKAVILSAEIFSDYENYDSAIELLAPYTSGRDDFAAQTIFMTARIYERQNKVSQADMLYRRIYEELPKSSYAEEAMYRSGEVYYAHEKYSDAYSKFTSYIYKYTSGTFSDAALFYGGDCALRLGETDRAIMLNRTLLQKYPSSVYLYGANKNLLTAYYSQENYSQALLIAKTLIKDFPQQAADDEIGKRLIELEKIVNGTDRRVAEKETEFAKLGEGSAAGRHAGTELVRLYAESLYTQKEAYDLATRLLAKQTAGSELADAASNAEFIADYERRNGQNKKAAQMYLRAAEYYRGVKNEQGAAGSLYGAAEAFTAEGLIGDARETAKLLKELYPDSVQAQRVDRVTGDARN